jgi:mannan endo-1,4-beta-mannosidase
LECDEVCAAFGRLAHAEQVAQPTKSNIGQASHLEGRIVHYVFFKALPYRIICFSLLLVLSLVSCTTVTPPTPPAPEIPDPITSKAITFGSYTYGGVWQGMEPVFALEADLGQKISVVHWFSNWYNLLDHQSLELASQGGRIPMISWQPHDRKFDDMISGKFDGYIKSWARSAKSFGKTIYLRPFPEMNGNWTSWNGEPEKLVIAWRHIVDVFRAEGASNVVWVWSPNATDEPRIESNRMELYYPGGNYVDILALDGYNWGNTKPSSGWRGFEAIFTDSYERITKLGSQPVWFAEVASTEQGGDKAKWIEDMFSTTAFPRLEGIIWFDEHKETDWRVDSSDKSLQAFRKGLNNNLKLALASK